MDPRTYWNGEGANKTFSHPLDLGWLRSRLSLDARILDVGCGYGRLMHPLLKSGFTHLHGVDPSEALIQRARREVPGVRFDCADPARLPAAAASADLVLLFAVLTCIPEDAAQEALVSELDRVLRPGGLLYVSDLLLQTDARNVARYAAFAPRYGQYGVFETSDGAVCRHHEPGWFDRLFAGFEVVERADVEVATMNGHGSVATQRLLRKAPSP